MKNFPYTFGDGVYSKLPKKELLSIYKKADLLIMDADETVAPNITVGLANEIFNKIIFETLTNKDISEASNSGNDNSKDCLKSILTPKEMLKKIFAEVKAAHLSPKISFFKYKLLSKLALNGLRLYSQKFTSQLIARLIHKKASHKKILKIVVNTLTDGKIKALFKQATGSNSFVSYFYTHKEAEASLYLGIKEFVNSLSKKNKKLKRVMISESFGIQNNIKTNKTKKSAALKNSKNQKIGLVENYQDIFKLNALYSNEFLCDKFGNILDVKINIQCTEDKKKFAQETIVKYKAKNVIVMANDWEDWEMCTLPEVKLVILRDPPKGMEKYATIVVKDGYQKLINKA